MPLFSLYCTCELEHDFSVTAPVLCLPGCHQAPYHDGHGLNLWNCMPNKLYLLWVVLVIVSLPASESETKQKSKWIVYFYYCCSDKRSWHKINSWKKVLCFQVRAHHWRMKLKRELKKLPTFTFIVKSKERTTASWPANVLLFSHPSVILYSPGSQQRYGSTQIVRFCLYQLTIIPTLHPEWHSPSIETIFPVDPMVTSW